MKINPFITRKTVDKLAVAKLPIVSALPAVTSADHGKEVFLAVDEAGTYGGPYLWHCKYMHYKADGVTPNPNAYKWQMVDAHPLRHEIISEEGTGGIGQNNWGDPATPGPQIIVPFAGDYVYEAEAFSYFSNNSASNPIQVVGISIDGAAPLASDTRYMAPGTAVPAGQQTWPTARWQRKKDALAKNSVVKMRYQWQVQAPPLVGGRVLSLKPKRIG